MFVANFRLKSLVQKVAMALSVPLGYAALHPFRELQRRALAQTADFIAREMPAAVAFDTPRDLLEYALGLVPADGLVAEFGVNEGGTVNFIARHFADRPVHGFDSFEGLPEDWAGAHIPRGYFSRRGQAPRVRPNVVLHPGWFADTLPGFVSAHAGPVAFLHVDCDLYSSTATIFQHLEDRLRPGTVLLFDEYFNYPNWQSHEHRAFLEFVARGQRRFDYVAYSFAQVAVVIR